MTPEQIAGLVKPLKWKKRGNRLGDIYCNTEFGQYSIGDIHGQIIVFLRRIEDGQDDDREIDYSDSFEGGKVAAQEDYVERTKIGLNLALITALAEDAARAHDLALEVERLKVALAQAAVPLEGLTLAAHSTGSNMGLCKGTWDEINNGVSYIRAALDTHAATAAVLSACDSIQ